MSIHLKWKLPTLLTALALIIFGAHASCYREVSHASASIIAVGCALRTQVSCGRRTNISSWNVRVINVKKLQEQFPPKT